MDNHQISIWFSCRLCVEQFQQIEQFLDHKRQEHLAEFRQEKYILFEERVVNLNILDEFVVQLPLCDIINNEADFPSNYDNDFGRINFETAVDVDNQNRNPEYLKLEPELMHAPPAINTDEHKEKECQGSSFYSSTSTCDFFNVANHSSQDEIENNNFPVCIEQYEENEPTTSDTIFGLQVKSENYTEIQGNISSKPKPASGTLDASCGCDNEESVVYNDKDDNDNATESNKEFKHEIDMNNFFPTTISQFEDSLAKDNVQTDFKHNNERTVTVRKNLHVSDDTSNNGKWTPTVPRPTIYSPTDLFTQTTDSIDADVTDLGTCSGKYLRLNSNNISRKRKNSNEFLKKKRVKDNVHFNKQ